MAAPVQPVAPKELVARLPSPPPDWKLTVSRAYHEATGRPGLIAIAIREYRWTPPPAAAEESLLPSPGDPAIVNLTLIDMAKTAESAPVFAWISQTQDTRSAEKRRLISGVPVVEEVTPLPRTFTFDLSSRFLLVLKVQNLTEKMTEAWLDRLNLPALLAAAEKAGKLPVPGGPVSIAWFDELDPKSNRVTQLNTPEP